MAKKVKDGKNALKVQLQPLFTCDNGEGYKFKIVDFGSYGVKISLADFHDIYAVLLPPVVVWDIVEWLTRTTGQPANALPIQIIDVLKKAVKHNKAEPFLEAEERRIVKRAIKTLKSLMLPYASKAAINRAIQKRSKSVPKKYR